MESCALALALAHLGSPLPGEALSCLAGSPVSRGSGSEGPQWELGGGGGVRSVSGGVPSSWQAAWFLATTWHEWRLGQSSPGWVRLGGSACCLSSLCGMQPPCPHLACVEGVNPQLPSPPPPPS